MSSKKKPKLLPERQRRAGRSQVAAEHRIPARLVAQILRNNGVDSVGKAITWGAEHYADEVVTDPKTRKKTTKVLISSNVIENVHRGVTKTLRFEQVDLILTELESPDEWFFPPLCDHYFQEGVDPEPEYETFMPHAEAVAASRDLMMAGLADPETVD